MNGLRVRDRDVGLAARAGDGRLQPLPESLLKTLLVADLMGHGAAAVSGFTVEHARWKPGVSLTVGYSLQRDDGSEVLLYCKRYASDKATILQRRSDHDDLAWRTSGVEVPDGFRRRVLVLPELSSAVWVFPADRCLPGLPRVADMRRTRRFAERAGLFGEWHIRSHRSRAQLLRHKPERRAVFRLDLVLRRAAKRRERQLALRVLPPDEARRIARARTACGGGELMPGLLAVEERTGLLFEDWLEATVPEPDDFSAARLMGECLGRLHALPVPERRDSLRTPPPATPAELQSLFAWSPTLLRLARGFNGLRGRAARCWTHGDPHPDQLALAGAGLPRLLDLDALGLGDPAEDLATWIADHLSTETAATFEEAAGALLDGHQAGGGPRIEERVLRSAVAGALLRQAAGCLRRVERDAEARAALTLERARDLAPRGIVSP